MYQELKEETDRLYGKNEELKERTEELVKLLDDILQRIEKQIHNIEGFPEEYLHAVEKITHRWINPNSSEEKSEEISKKDSYKFTEEKEFSGMFSGMMKTTKRFEEIEQRKKQEKEKLKEQYQLNIGLYEDNLQRYVPLRGLLEVLIFTESDEKKYDEFDEGVKNLIDAYFCKVYEVETAMS